MEENNKKIKRQDNITLIKTIMMLIVVLYHSMRFFTGEWFNIYGIVPVSSHVVFITRFFKMFHVQTFCMASGFLYFYLKQEKHKYNNFKSNVINKAKRLLLPYISTCIIWAIPISIYFYNYNIKEIVYKFVLMSSPAQLWFLITLFNVFILFFVFNNKVKFSIRNLLIIYLITTIVGITLETLNIHYFQLDTTAQYCLFFYFGGFIYSNREKISNKATFPIIIVLGLLLIYFTFYNDSGLIHFLMRFIEPTISMLEILIIYKLCTYFVQLHIINNQLFSIISENSFGIYLFHQQIIYIVIATFYKMVSSVALVIMSFSISIILSLIICLLLKKNKYTKLLFGF